MSKTLLALSTTVAMGLSTVGVVNAGTTYAYSSTTITLNGKQMSTPSHIAAKDPFAGANASVTSFLPIWYTDALLQDAGITPSWDGQTLNLQVPSSITVDYPTTPSPMTLSSNVMAIKINGKVVAYAPKISYNDKGSSTFTTFVPVYYLQKTFAYLGFQTTWDGTTWAMTASGVTQPQSFYIATTGSDENDGSMAHPWATIQHAVDVVPNGATIYLQSGVYHQRVLIQNKGDAQNTGITITNAPNEHAVLDGTGLSVHSGGLITIKDSRGITINGLEIQNYSTNSAADTPMGIEVTGADTNIQLINNHIHNIDTTVPSADGNAHGIGVYGTETLPITGLKIIGNEVDHLQLGSSEAIALNGNVEGFSVANNLVHNNNNIGIDVIGFEGTAPSVNLDRARDGTIADNEVYNISSYGNPAYGNQYAADGIYVDGGTNITITQNRVYDNDFGVELASEHQNGNTSYITMTHNWIYNNRAAGLAMGGYDNQRGYTSNCQIAHNTLYANDSLNTGDGQVYFAYDVHDITMTYNLVYGIPNDVLIGNPFSQNLNNTLDHNYYYSPDGLDNVQFQWKTNTWTGFSDYQTGTGNDGASVFQKPTFVNAPSGDLNQTADSSARAYGA